MTTINTIRNGNPAAQVTAQVTAKVTGALALCLALGSSFTATANTDEAAMKGNMSDKRCDASKLLRKAMKMNKRQLDTLVGRTYGRGCSTIKAVKQVGGFATTGSNKNLGKQIWDLGVGNDNFDFVYALDSEGKAQPITEDTPGDSVLATNVDPNYLKIFGMTPADVDQRLLNVPLREVSMIVAPWGERGQVLPMDEVPVGSGGLAYPNGPITLDDWMDASGKAVFVCYEDGSSDIQVNVKNLVPHGLYTAWVNKVVDSSGDGVPDRLGGASFGGLPNTLMANDKGRGVYRRHLNFCPQEQEGFRILNFAYHSDGTGFGAMPDLPMGGYPGGTTVHAHLHFPMNVGQRQDQ